jgi:transmembrane sensor
MSTSSAEMRRARAAAEAAEWTVRLDSEDLSMPDRAELENWLRESPMHIAEMLRIGKLTTALSKFDWERIPPGTDLPVETVSILAALRAPGSPMLHRRHHRSRWFAGIAASLACVAVSLVLFRQQLSTTAIHTQVGERREITLADGSIVRLASNTDLRVRLQAHMRSVVIERGEAIFRVAKDASRPFIVDAASARVQAVGTLFSVARNATSVVVTVTEGRVSVTPAATSAEVAHGANTLVLSLRANEGVAVSANGTTSAVRRVENVPTLEWSDNRLAFEHTRVADVVNQFNRRNPIQIRLSNNIVGSRIVSGIFDASDPQSFVDFLRTIAGTTSVNSGDEIVVTLSATGAGPLVPVR